MSELEIQRRKEYKRNRRIWTIVQIAAIALLVAIALGSFVIYRSIDRTQYIEYTENSGIDYKVQYKENDFFESEWIDKDQSYISSLINTISADFTYAIDINSNNMDLKYTYWIDAKLSITNKNGGAAYYTVEDNILPMKSALFKKASEANIKENVPIDYVKYDQIARSFIGTYDLKDATSILSVTLFVETECSNQSFTNECKNTYSTSLNIPIAEDTFTIHSTQSSPSNEVKSFEYQGFVSRIVFGMLILAIAVSVVAVLLFIGLLIFLHLTKNEDITYAAKIRKILSAYGSFIQRIEGEFDSEGYQIVMIKTFNEMLGIRDTIQSPVLMFENRDETMTRFFIPTNTKLLYVFEIKVDNYDEIYAKVEEPPVEEPVVEEPVVEEEVIDEPVVLEEVDENELAEALAQPDVELNEIEFIPDDDDQFEVAPEEPGIEVIGVVWPEKAKKNKVYRYDPNGEILEQGDIVIVPTMDRHKGREVIRKVAVAHGNHRVDPEHIKHPLKKIIAVIRHSVTHSLPPHANEEARIAAEESAAITEEVTSVTEEVIQLTEEVTEAETEINQ